MQPRGTPLGMRGFVVPLVGAIISGFAFYRGAPALGVLLLAGAAAATWSSIARPDVASHQSAIRYATGIRLGCWTVALLSVGYGAWLSFQNPPWTIIPGFALIVLGSGLVAITRPLHRFLRPDADAGQARE
jgi:hypothetical protein